MLMAVLTLALGFVAPAWAVHTADPLEEFYAQHVLPFYKIDAGWQSFAIFADTSFNDPAVGCDPGRDTPCAARVHLYFFDKSCNLQRDHVVFLTANDVTVVQLSTLPGLPPEGVIFADTGVFAGSDDEAKFDKRFLAYIVTVNPADNTLTRIDSIPFSPSLNDVTGTGHWTRYDPFNTIAATFGDSTGTTAGAIRTTLMFFNALGGGARPTPGSLTDTPLVRTIVGARDTLREFMAYYGFPRSGDWVTTGGSATANVSPGQIELDAFNDNEDFLGSFRLAPVCFERVRLGSLIPALINPAPAGVGHVVAFSLLDGGRTLTCPDFPTSTTGGRCAFSGFQETTVESGVSGGVDLIFSGYFHHSSAGSGNSQPLRPGR
jgi:hypothetical protein